MKKLLYLTAALVLVLGACKKKDQTVKPPLTISSFLPASGLGGTLVTIYGKGFGDDTLTNIVTFNGLKATIFEVTDTSLVVVAPASGTTGPVVVTAGGRNVTAGTYTYQLLSLHSASPLNGPAGTNVVITGAGLSGKTGPASVTFNGRPAIVVSSSDTSVTAAVPDSAGVGPIVVTVDGSTATGPVFTYQVISFITPLTGGAGTTDSIHGAGFGTDASKVTMSFNGTNASVVSISDTMIVAKAPASVATGPVSVTINGQKTVGPVFTVVPAPVITGVDPTSGLANTVVTITGRNFSAVAAQDQVDFNGVAAVTQAATTAQITVVVPLSATTGNIHVTVNGQTATGPVFTVQPLNITVLTPNNGLDGTTVTISGSGFNTNPASNQVFFNGLPAVVTSAQTNQLVVTVPTGFSTGNVTITSGGLSATGPLFSKAGVITVLKLPNQYIEGIGADLNGNVYYTVAGNNSIQQLAPDGTVTNYAGNPNVSGSADGPVASATFASPFWMTSDGQGNLYIQDNNGIRMISTATGTVSTPLPGLTNVNAMGFSQPSQTNEIYFALRGQSGIFNVLPPSPAYNTLAGTSYIYQPTAVGMDVSGTLYFSTGSNVSKLVNGTQTTLTNNFSDIIYLAPDPYTGNLAAVDFSDDIVEFDQYTGAQITMWRPTAFGAYDTDGTLAQATVQQMDHAVVTNQGVFYIVDYNSSIRKVFFH